jgi:hypothetical protein
MSFRIIGKIGLVLVVIGFFMPIACDQSGFKIAEYMVKNDNVIDGILLYLVFVSAAIGIFIGVLLLANRGVSSTADWITVIVSIASGIFVYVKHLKGGPDLQNGAYVILAGWIVAFVFQLISTMRRER